MLACQIPLDSHFVPLLSVALLSRTFYPFVEAKCTLGVSVCRFSGVPFILAFKEDLGLYFGLYSIS